LAISQSQQEKNDKEKEKKPNLWEMIRFKIKADWTYNSNAIEGSSLSLGDTIFFLQEGLTVKGKPLKDHLDAQNHAEAIEVLFERVVQKRPITESLIKEINALLLNGVRSTPAITLEGQKVEKPTKPEQYKKHPNHVLQPDGELHRYVEPLQIDTEMADLVQWIDKYINTLPAPFVAAVAHYNLVRIHPFDDGNGRGARILMNLVLIQKGFIPAVIKTAQKQTYYQTLRSADNGDLIPFIQLITEHLIETQEMILNDFQA